MTGKEVDDLARMREPLPDSAGLCDMMLYHTLICLYNEYKAKLIPKEIARKEKLKALEKHKELTLSEEIYRYHSKRITELNVLVIEARKQHTCPLCERMYDVFSGYQRKESK